jgi:hypothetical protein
MIPVVTAQRDYRGRLLEPILDGYLSPLDAVSE